MHGYLKGSKRLTSHFHLLKRVFIYIYDMRDMTVTNPGFVCFKRRVLDFMIEFIWPLYDWLQQFTKHYLDAFSQTELNYWLNLTRLSFDYDSLRPLVVTELYYDRRSVGQSALVSSTHLGHMTRVYFYCQTIAGLLMWGALSEERTGLSFTMYNIKYIYILHVFLR
jgi:hypothetical protein